MAPLQAIPLVPFGLNHPSDRLVGDRGLYPLWRGLVARHYWMSCAGASRRLIRQGSRAHASRGIKERDMRP